MEHKLFYDSPAENFNGALPLGNGRIGAMVYGNPASEVITLNEDTLWSGYPVHYSHENTYDAFLKAREMVFDGKIMDAELLLEKDFFEEYTQSYMPLGTIHISSELDGEITDYSRSLDLSKAVCTTKFSCSGNDYVRKNFICNKNDAFFTEITCNNPGQINIEVSIDSLLRSESEINDEHLILKGLCPSDTPRLFPDDDENKVIYYDDDERKGISFTAVLKIKQKNGTILYEENKIKVSKADKAVIYFCVKTSFNGYDKHPYLEGKEHYNTCIEQIDTLYLRHFDQIKQEHYEDYADLYGRVTISLNSEDKKNVPTDKRLSDFQKDNSDLGLYELLFNFGRYLIIAGSRAGTQATNLQGIWNESLRPPWNSNYTVNINTEMNYWPVLMCNLTECHLPIVELVQKIRQTGKKTAQKFYNAKGFVSHHNIDLWGHTTPVGKNNSNSVIYAFWNMSSGWLCRHLFEQYEYTGDVEFLKDVCYPTMKEAVEFYLDLLVEDKDGYLIIEPSTSPENEYILNGEHLHLSVTTTMTMGIVKDLFKNCIRSAEILDIDEDFRLRLEETYKKLLPFKIGSRGQLLEWYDEFEENDPHHRHISHLYALHPADLINTEDTAELADACRQTLLERGDDGTGWSLGWKVNFWARLKDGDHALKLVKNQLRPVESSDREVYWGGGTYINMFDAHPPFQIDGNFGVTSGIAEMLLQNSNGKIILLPALPSEWPDGEFSGLKAKGNITVSAKWKNGKLKDAVLLSPVSQTVYVKYGEFTSEIELKKNIPYQI